MFVETVTLSKLPISVQKQIPLSIRLYKDEYKLDELPIDIQNLILSSLSKVKDVEDNRDSFFDVLLDIDSRGDLKHITNLKELVLEYLKTYFGITEGYPFDPKFANKLKKYLHKRNINVVRQLINEEINKIIDVIKSDLDVLIRIKETKIDYVGEDVIVKLDVEINSQPTRLELKY